VILKGKNAVITGCLQGIGRATLELFAQNGANVWACAQAPKDDFEEFCEELSDKNNVWVKPVYFDLLDNEQIKEAVKNISKDKLPVDVLINLAGMTKDAVFYMTSMDTVRQIFEVNFFAQMIFTQYISKLMLRLGGGGGGNIFNVYSISALDGNAGQFAYSSSKAALLGATKTLSIELAPHNIRVNAVAPGVIDTAMTKNLPETIINDKIKCMNIKRLGLPEEVGKVLLFLASDLSSYITGQIIRIDGGIK
jgi:3-oxoacyl-[acyl-carrier protein] reductase